MSLYAPPSSVSSLFDLADSYLQAIVAAMTSTAAGAPKRAFVYPGQTPVFEDGCAQAAVAVRALGEENTAPPGPAMQLGRRFLRGRVNLVSLSGYAVRCVEVTEGNQQVYQSLSDATLNAQSLAVYEDGWALWETITTLLRNDDLFPGPCGDVHFVGGQPIPPDGGLAGWVMALQVELPGYVPSLTWPPVMP